MMIRHWLMVFCVFCTVCSDCGLQVTGGCFKAKCSVIRIRHAKSFASLSPSNLEVARRQLFEKLPKIHLTNKHRNRCEEMWPSRNAHHDTVTRGGLSPEPHSFRQGPPGPGTPLVR